jgi:hypothetical protein
MWSILPNHSALSERRQHVDRTVEVRHFDVCGADTLRIVRIGAHARRDTELLREFERGEIIRRVGDLGVEHLDDVQLTRGDKCLQYRLSQSGTFGIEWVWRVHESALRADALNHFANREDVGYSLRQEQADDLSRRSADFFAHDDPDFQIATKGLCRVDRVMVSDAHHVEVHRFDALSQLLQRRAGIARGGRMQMTVKPYPAGAGRWWRPNGTKQQKGD